MGLLGLLLLGVAGFRLFRSPPALDRNPPAATATATFALGCFWGPEARLAALPGVVRTRVGYCGGTTANPDYFHLGDHSEAVQVEFDPVHLDYAQLLQEARQLGDFGSPVRKRQYRSAVFTHDSQQAQLARQQGLAEVEPAGRFYLAEDSHQKYYLQQQVTLMRELRSRFADFRSFNNSTSAALGNAMAAGVLPRPQVEQLLPGLEFSAPAQQLLLRRAEEPLPPGCGVRPMSHPP